MGKTATELKEVQEKVKNLDEVVFELLGLQCLTRVIQDSAGCYYLKTERKEHPERVLEDVEMSLQSVIDGIERIVDDIQAITKKQSQEAA